MSEETKTTTLTEEEQAELELLQAEETLDEENTKRLAELLAKQGDAKVAETVTETAENTTETAEDVTEEPETETYVPVGDSEDIPVYRLYHITRVDRLEDKDENRLWGVLISDLPNGLRSSANCFVLDSTKERKVGDILEVPSSVSIRQSTRKLTEEEIKKGIKPTIFDWLFF